MSSSRKKQIALDDNIVTFLSTSSNGLPKWRQSPVDLSKNATWMQGFPPLLLNGHWSNEGKAVMTNTGTTVSIELANRQMPYLRGGPLKDDVFQFLNTRFRWGPSNVRGAEHSIDNMWYSMEAQTMHWNTRYESIDKCYTKPDGIAILSYLMQVVGCPSIPDNPGLRRITKYLPMIKKTGTSIEVPPDCLWWMLEACITPGYYTYPGSLTVSPYSECVIWIIVASTLRISAHQVDAFRSLYNNRWQNIVSNYRPQQHLRGRRIFYAIDTTSC